MTTNIRRRLAACVVSIFAFSFIHGTARADDRPWTVEKSSGEVWIARSGADKVALDVSGGVKPGDDIRTGRNGRVMLSRGEERIMVQPNSAIAIPAQQTGQYATTIQQQAGTILLQVEKKNVQHFEVETPYLAAVVKGTQFRVSVNSRGASVAVTEGRVQVADFKSGQNALVDPGQRAVVNAAGKGGLILRGNGKFNPVETGAPRVSGVQAMIVPRNGMQAPAGAVAIQPTAATEALAKSTDGARGVEAGTPKNSAIGGQEGKFKNGKRASLNGITNAVQGGGAGEGLDGGSNANLDTAIAINSGAAGNAAVIANVGSGAAGSVANTAGRSALAVGGFAGGKVSAVGGTVNNIGNVAGGAVGGLGNTVGGTVSGLGNVVGGPVGGTVSGVGNTVGGTVAGVGNTVGGTTNAVGNTVGGLTGGLLKK